MASQILADAGMATHSAPCSLRTFQGLRASGARGAVSGRMLLARSANGSRSNLKAAAQAVAVPVEPKVAATTRPKVKETRLRDL
jgi:hypothetical protein